MISVERSGLLLVGSGGEAGRKLTVGKGRDLLYGWRVSDQTKDGSKWLFCSVRWGLMNARESLQVNRTSATVKEGISVSWSAGADMASSSTLGKTVVTAEAKSRVETDCLGVTSSMARRRSPAASSTAG